MFRGLSSFLVLLLLVSSVKASGREKKCQVTQQITARIGCVIDLSSRVSKEQKIAMEMAVRDLFKSTCAKVDLQLKDSQGNSARATAAAINLLISKEVVAIVGRLTVQEADLISEIDNTTENIPIFIQIANSIVFHTQCVAALVGHVQWRKVTAVYENNNEFFSTSGIKTLLSDSLRLLKKLRRKRNKVFIAWIVTDGIASLLDSVNTSVKYNMQGVIGVKTNFVETTSSFRLFKTRFHRIYGLQEMLPQRIVSKYLSTASRGLSGMLEFKNGMLSQPPTFKIINVNLMEKGMDNGFSEVLRPTYWPDGLQTTPKCCAPVNVDWPLKIGVPARGAFKQFVNVRYYPDKNETHISGFSIDVFKAAVQHLPYQLPYVFVPFNGSYDEMVKLVYNKSFDAAVGDFKFISDRYHYVEFTEPYISSGLEMVVTVKPDKLKEKWMFMHAFTKEMWFLLFVTHLSVYNPKLKGTGAMLWFSVTVLFFAHRKRVHNNWARLVLAPWLVVILVVTATFTASLTSMMTLSQVQPSVLDIETLQKMNATVGCNGNSFIVRYLTNVLDFRPENIQGIASIDDYPNAFEKQDIAAAFFVMPHAKVFPKGSHLAIDISEAILEVTENRQVEKLEEEMLTGLSSPNCTNKLNGGPMGIGPGPFSGLFLISGPACSLAILVVVARTAGKHLRDLSYTRLRAMLIN
ncbi:glutamate receptor 2.5-like [Pyrus ussuriensis x Pyrus communis]|uniref:Glutamate receptor 2.5-like n=1 Tax=Pyrus ussuriensis x Pyrus communis TaxID=2448454 RepID=A0A5N5H209_9ROSA|nr:glutamate receptor 2.5-like [Pyrus ussuriensis x Pyrus communis]